MTHLESAPEIQKEETIVEEKPVYGEKRYELVDHVLAQLHAKEQLDKVSPVQAAAMRAQAPYKTLSMKDLKDTYQGPPKYLSQRDAPLEIPVEIIQKLFQAIDVDLDDRISLEELHGYVKLSGVPLEEGVVDEMFLEASKNRPIIHEAQRHQGLTFEEVQQAVRGRFQAKKGTSGYELEWDVSYRPCRDYWILLLLTISDRLFALQVPKIVPGKIRAQYETQDELARIKESLARGELTFKQAEGIDRKYQSIKSEKTPMFVRDTNKKEAGIMPEPHTSLVYAEEKVKKAQQDPYEKSVNSKVNHGKFTFQSKELYEQAHHLCQQIPHWKTDEENPIFQYVPTSERPFKSSADDFFVSEKSTKSVRELRLSALNQKNTSSLKLAGTMALKAREKSPQTKIRERNGFVTATRVPDCFEDKLASAKALNNKYDKKSQSMVPVQNEYVMPAAHKFRDEFEVEIGMKDFLLRTKPPKIDNPHFLSVFDKKPKYHAEREKMLFEKKEAIDKFLAANKPHDWKKYHDLPEKLIPMSQQFQDHHNKWNGKTKEEAQFLDKEKWIPAYLELARTMKDDFVYGKPKLDLYYRGLKSEHLDKEFSGTTKPFKLIN